ncbi:MAG: HAD family hydrolase [Phycisphaeraceae bacterium]|nr:HAD family hydrolase [Phycisphaeraceae bacterium]
MCRQAAIESLRGIAPIQAVVSDVDGVLTDGRIGLSSDGATIRSFNMKDGMGTGLLREAGVKVGWCSAGVDDGVIRRRGEHLNVDAIDVGHGDKGERFAAICASLGVAPDRVVYIGDDINDLPAMAMAGLSACPADAVESVRTRVDLVLSMRGGMGCFRELVELILASRGG